MFNFLIEEPKPRSPEWSNHVCDQLKRGTFSQIKQQERKEKRREGRTLIRMKFDRVLLKWSSPFHHPLMFLWANGNEEEPLWAHHSNHSG